MDSRLVKNGMLKFIHRAPDAIFACTFMKTLFTNAPTANRTLMALNYNNENQPTKLYLKITFLAVGVMDNGESLSPHPQEHG